MAASSLLKRPLIVGAKVQNKLASSLGTTYGGEAKWSRAKAELGVIEGNGSGKENKKAALTWLLSTYNVLIHLSYANRCKGLQWASALALCSASKKELGAEHCQGKPRGP